MKLRCQRPIWLAIKRLFDITAALCLLVLLGFPMALLALLLWREGGGAFFAHRRVGRKGRPFNCYKFRTMVPNADQRLAALLASDPAAKAEWEQCFKLTNDPRITALGRFLRSSSLDELPQLWNVVKGDMSLVGPRPVVEAELVRYGRHTESYFAVKPGITGLWQVSGRNNTSYDERVALDCRYVASWSMLLDMQILFRTIAVVISRQGAY